MSSETKRIEIKRECPSCSGTGLYRGMEERNGFAVVCHSCEGSGCDVFRMEYRDFKGRAAAPKGVLRVLQTNPGYAVSPDHTPGGVTLEEWESDPKSPMRAGAELRGQVCPAWWYQSADYEKKPRWNECDEALGRRFADCPHFANKPACWDRWDREFREKTL